MPTLTEFQERILIRYFGFERAPVYLFLSGIFVTLSASLAITGFISIPSSVQAPIRVIYGLAGCFLVSSVSTFYISAKIDAAKQSWQDHGAQAQSQWKRRELEPNLSHFMVALALSASGLLISVILAIVSRT